MRFASREVTRSEMCLEAAGRRLHRMAAPRALPNKQKTSPAPHPHPDLRHGTVNARAGHLHTRQHSTSSTSPIRTKPFTRSVVRAACCPPTVVRQLIHYSHAPSLDTGFKSPSGLKRDDASPKSVCHLIQFNARPGWRCKVSGARVRTSSVSQDVCCL